MKAGFSEGQNELSRVATDGGNRNIIRKNEEEMDWGHYFRHFRRRGACR
jgi:hypothetical protein